MDQELFQEKVKSLLKLNSDGYLFHRESRELEFKEQFNFGGLADYLRDFSAFANNSGGFLIFGVTDTPRRLSGLSSQAFDAFNKIDPEAITGFILEYFATNINWDCTVVEYRQKKFGAFYIEEAINKPIIAKKDAGQNQVIKNGEIYYRYAGRTQRIQHAELHNIIQKRIDAKSNEWKNLISALAKVNPSNAHILTLEGSGISKDNNILYMDKNLANQISFIKEGEFNERQGAKALKVVGDVQILGAETIEQIKTESLIESYPLTYIQLVEKIKEELPDTKQGDINSIIKENNIKTNPAYSTYNFKSKAHRDNYENNGILASGTPSIYNNNAVEFITTTLLVEDL